MDRKQAKLFFINMAGLLLLIPAFENQNTDAIIIILLAMLGISLYIDVNRTLGFIFGVLTARSDDNKTDYSDVTYITEKMRDGTHKTTVCGKKYGTDVRFGRTPNESQEEASRMYDHYTRDRR